MYSRVGRVFLFFSFFFFGVKLPRSRKLGGRKWNTFMKVRYILLKNKPPRSNSMDGHDYPIPLDKLNLRVKNEPAWPMYKKKYKYNVQYKCVIARQAKSSECGGGGRGQARPIYVDHQIGAGDCWETYCAFLALPKR